MKHVGKMKNNSAKVAVAYRTIPGEPNNCLVIGTQGLVDSYHDSLMSVVQDDSAQQANELADILSSRRFPDGNNMLAWLHVNGHLKKVPTNMVLMTPNTQQTIQLDELNKLIAEQKGVSVEDLAITDGSKPTKKPVEKTTSESVNQVVVDDEPSTPENLTPAQLRSRADALFKQAQLLRKQADSIDPPKSKIKKVSVEV